MTEPTCRIEDCNNAVSVKRDQLCRKHYSRQVRLGDPEAPTRGYTKQSHLPCSVDGCSRPSHIKGYCKAHYLRWWRTGDAGPAEIEAQERGTCSVENCDRPHQARGYCYGHYDRVKKYGAPGEEPLAEKMTRPEVCIIEGCNDPVRAKGYCAGHYMQARTGDGTFHEKRKVAPAGSGYINKDGYRFIRVNGKSRGEHRVVAERVLGRPLLKEEEVHHRDGQRDRNVVDGPFHLNHRGQYVSGNLEIWSTSQPKGQEIGPKMEWALEILSTYGNDAQRGLLAEFEKLATTAYEQDEDPADG